jgi:hypothetical protein
MSDGNARWGLQSALDEHVEGFGQGLAFALRDGGLFFEQARRELHPGRFRRL